MFCISIWVVVTWMGGGEREREERESSTFLLKMACSTEVKI